MADVSVRPAGPGDVAEIARMQVETWRYAYARLLPEAVLEALSIPAAESAWSAAVSDPPSRSHHVFVALEQDWRVGFAATAPAAPDEEGELDAGSTFAVAALLVEPRWGRRGHGSRLLAAVVDTARNDGMTHGIAWIAEGDSASKDFYVSAGWAPDGYARELDTGTGPLREIRLHVGV